MKRIKTAVVGCGSISDIYMTNLTNGKFTVMELVACSDLMVERMNASAAKFGIKAMSLDEICADPEIEMVICLTTPAAHYPIIKQALLAGKHVFSEKMIAVDLWQNNPCYLCARMRRGYLYSKAKELGCNKIALGHHFDDVIETILMSMLYGGQVETMMPKLLRKKEIQNSS